MIVHIPQELTNLAIGISAVFAVRQVHPLLIDGTDQPLSLPTPCVPGLANLGHTNLDVLMLKQI